AQLLERQWIVEQGRVDHRSRDCQLPARHRITPPSLARAAGELRRGGLGKEREPFRRARTITQPAVRNTSVPSVAHAAPSIDSAGMSRALSARFTTSASAHSPAYARWPSQPTS